jgi:hypothetical protein
MEWTNFICFNCVHAIDNPIGCKAYPDGLPDQVFETNKHNKPFKGQKNNLIYTPKKRIVNT